MEFGKQYNTVTQFLWNSLLLGEHEDGIDVTAADLEYTLENGSHVQFHRGKTGPRNASSINK